MTDRKRMVRKGVAAILLRHKGVTRHDTQGVEDT